MGDTFNIMSGIASFYDGYRNIVEDCCEIYVSSIEMILGFWGKSRQIFDKNKNHQVELFNSYMSGYEKAKIDFGIAVKEPSEIYY
jgi:hypothetical protein